MIDPNLAWQGYLDDSAQTITVHMRDYYDCDGSRGVRVLVIDESAQWCADCQSQAQTLTTLAPGKWKSEGVELLVLMAQDQQENPATADTALSWRNEYASRRAPCVADPRGRRSSGTARRAPATASRPTSSIDPRTMRIVAFQPTDLAGTVDNLAIANGS